MVLLLVRAAEKFIAVYTDFFSIFNSAAITCCWHKCVKRVICLLFLFLEIVYFIGSQTYLYLPLRTLQDIWILHLLIGKLKCISNILKQKGKF